MNGFRNFYQKELSKNKRKDLIVVMSCIEAILAFSYFGYLDFKPISINTLPILVIVAAMLFGFKGCLPVVLMFAFTSMWKASISAIQYKDLVFSPFKSGNPINSLLLVIPRILFAYLTAILFDSYFRKEHEKPYVGIIIIALISTTLHNLLLGTFVRNLFDVDSFFSSSFIINGIVMYALTILIVCAFYKLFSSNKIQNSLKAICVYKMHKSGKKYGALLGATFLILVSISVLDLLSQLVKLKEINIGVFRYLVYTQDGEILLQFFFAFACALIAFVIVFGWMSDFYLYTKMSVKENELKLESEQKANRTLKEEHEELLEKNKALEINYEIISGISILYATIYRIDLISGEYEQIKGNDVINTILEPRGYINKNFDESFKSMASFEYQDRLMEFLNLHTIKDRLKDKNTVFIEYKSCKNQWREVRFIAKKRDDKNNVTNVLFLVSDIDSQKKIENEYHATIETLVEEYAAVYICDLKKDKLTPFKISDNSFSSSLIDDKAGCYNSISNWNKYIWDKLLVRNTFPDYLDKLSPENLIKELMENEIYTIRFDTIPNPKGYSKYEGRYARINTGEDDEYKAILGYRNIDDVVALEKKRNEQLEEINKELMEQKKETELANSAKTNFLRRMSHDIRTPINGIIGTVKIASRFPNDLEKQSEYREKVMTSSSYLLALVNNILDMSKLESGEIKLENKQFDIKEVLAETCEIIKEYGNENGIVLHSDFKDIKHRYLIGSRVHFQQVLMNIVSNAAKYNKYGGEIYLTCKEIGDDGSIANFVFVCKDTGLGMSEEYQKHIFEPFTQEANDARTSYKGSGLGMPIAKELVELQGGTIDFESELNKGTTFTIHIPFKIDFAVRNENNDLKDKDIKGIKILVVEDNDLNMEIAQFFLEDKGAIVDHAYNGQEAIDKYQVGKYDVILMDIMMPLVDGYEATKKIRMTDKNIPIIAMSANAFADDIEKSLKSGMNAHVTKPLDISKLVEEINRLVKN